MALDEMHFSLAGQLQRVKKRPKRVRESEYIFSLLQSKSSCIENTSKREREREREREERAE